VALAFRASSTGGASGGGTFSVNKPAGTVDGDILIAVCGLDAGTANGMTNPTGWTQVRDDNDAGSVTLGMRILRKVASGEPASWSFTGAGTDVAVWIGAYSGGDTVTPTDGSNGGPVATSTTITAPTVTPTLTDDLLICAFCDDGAGAAASNITSMDASLTVRTIANGFPSPTTSLVRIAVGDKQLSSAAATGALTATSASSQPHVGAQVLLKTGVSAGAGISPGTPTWGYGHPPLVRL
jgi:hypothetical protein